MACRTTRLQPHPYFGPNSAWVWDDATGWTRVEVLYAIRRDDGLFNRVRLPGGRRRNVPNSSLGFWFSGDDSQPTYSPGHFSDQQ